MQATQFKMINNSIKTAQYRLEQHKMMGTNSQLSVLEVANLLDTIKKAESYIMPTNQPNIFQSIGFN